MVGYFLPVGHKPELAGSRQDVGRLQGRRGRTGSCTEHSKELMGMWEINNYPSWCMREINNTVPDIK